MTVTKWIAAWRRDCGAAGSYMPLPLNTARGYLLRDLDGVNLGLAPYAGRGQFAYDLVERKEAARRAIEKMTDDSRDFVMTVGMAVFSLTKHDPAGGE